MYDEEKGEQALTCLRLTASCVSPLERHYVRGGAVGAVITPLDDPILRSLCVVKRGGGGLIF